MAKRKQSSGCGSYFFLLIVFAVGIVASNPNLLIPIIITVIALVFISEIASRKSSREFEEHEQQKIALQNYVSEPHSTLVLTEKQLVNAANSYLNKRKKSMERCLEAMQKAETPKMYFAKLETYYQLKMDLEGLWDVWIGQFTVKFPSESDITRLTDNMLDRYWLLCKEKSINAATDGAKKHAYQVFFDTLDLYAHHLKVQNKQNISKYRQEYNEMYGANSIH